MSADSTTRLLSPSERERVLRAMAELSVEQGYWDTTVEQICERAGVSEEAFFALFDDVEDCMVAAINAILSEVMAAVSLNYSADRSEWDSYLLAIRGILELMAAHPSFAQLGYVASRQMGPPRLREGYEAGVRVLVSLIERLSTYSEGASQPSNAARGALGGAEAVVRRELMAGRIEQLPRLLPDFIYSATVPYLGQEEAMRLARRGRELLRGTDWE